MKTTSSRCNCGEVKVPVVQNLSRMDHLHTTLTRTAVGEAISQESKSSKNRPTCFLKASIRVAEKVFSNGRRSANGARPFWLCWPRRCIDRRFWTDVKVVLWLIIHLAFKGGAAPPSQLYVYTNPITSEEVMGFV